MKEILKSPIVRNTMKSLFDNKEIELIERPASYVVKLGKEEKEKANRIILLPPHGFTSNKMDLLSSHPETRRATVKIKGAVRPNKHGFTILKNVIKFSYYTQRNIDIEKEYPYAIVNLKNPFYKEVMKSSREKFFVVKENGTGFYHNLINISNEWILLILRKEILLQKALNIDSKILGLDRRKKKIIKDVISAIETHGDKIFDKQTGLINRMLQLEISEALPALINALNIAETGKHEPCIIYALILKFANKNRNDALKLIRNALESNEAPEYYLEELIKKIKRAKN